MRDTVNILGINVDRGGMKDSVKILCDFMNEDKPHAVYTPNPEIIMRAYKDSEYSAVLSRADLVVPDGIGVVYASKMLKKPVTERVAGFDLMNSFFDIAAEKNYSVFIFGGKEGVAKKAAENLEKRNIKIAGTAHGYRKDHEKVAEEIKESGADIVLVCIGFPNQEIWIDKYKDKTGAKILVGAGGSVDVFAGNVKRAPEFFCRHGLEWFYRLCSQPSRIIRMSVLPLFMLKVLFKGRKRDKK